MLKCIWEELLHSDPDLFPRRLAPIHASQRIELPKQCKRFQHLRLYFNGECFRICPLMLSWLTLLSN